MNNQGIIDIGANLTHPQLYNQLKTIIEHINNSKTEKVIITSSNLMDTALAKEIISLYPDLFYTTVGYHPHNAKDYDSSLYDKIINESNSKYVVAIGECGLDYYREYSSKEEQWTCFEAHLEIAKITKLPIFLHEREAHNDFIQFLKKYSESIKKKVVHCFTGNKSELKTYLDLGAYIGITGWISDPERGKHLLDLMKYIPEDRLMIETDAPYLIPKNIPGNKKDINEPSYLEYVAETIAQCLNKNLDDIMISTRKNTRIFFSI